MLEKYKNNESHFAIRLVVFLCIILLYVFFSFLFINPDQRSCLGPPRLLLFAAVVFPLITLLLFLDLIALACLKAINGEKALVNLGLFLSMMLYFFLVFA